ncbi:Type I inositol-1,4,5-trisphosphate 5-phosphatase CVP2 [Morus notabilis]|uniref:Type I inositol-1,4,5-trisphosphate 5-phosphatase CVP2 n=1 Tax=Morus notabilis TaxID=981085 RepID=W9QPW1_9ROSA|nr:Type I inositol-1,4,5-trisphosphate 5-phosphatase CVP2 [Morus notabilis]
MYSENNKPRTRGIPKWLKRKNKRPELYQPNELSDGNDQDESDDYLDDILVRSIEMDPCTPTNNELRIFVGTWNVAGRSPIGSLAVDLDEWLNLKDAADIYVLGFQEIVPLKTRTVIGAEDPTEATNWNGLIGKALNDKYGCPWLTPLVNRISSDNYLYVPVLDSERRKSLSSYSATPMRERSKTIHTTPNVGSKYKLMASKKMVGVFISVWMRNELLRKYCVSNVKVCSVACGIMGYLGNKGSVSVSMSIEGTSFCFIAAHLASGEKKGDEGRRNHQVSEIFRRTSFPRSFGDDDNPHPLTILGHDRIFWFGDLNYRLYLEDSLARQLIKKQDWRALQDFDQLRREQEYGGVFQGWKEGDIEFAPTYKYSQSNCNRYSGGLPSRTGEKQRTPACESKFSDHRPVSALFSTQIEVVKSNSARVVGLQTILPTILPNEQTGTSRGEDKGNSTLLSLMIKDLEASPRYMQQS